MDDPVLAQDFEAVVDLPDIPVEATGEMPDALGRSVHQTSHQLQAARREDALEPAGVLKVDDLENRDERIEDLEVENEQLRERNTELDDRLATVEAGPGIDTTASQQGVTGD
jgi:hypothetical protein